MDFSRKPLPMSRRDFVTSSAAVLATSRFAPIALKNGESRGGLGQAATPRGPFRVIIDTDPFYVVILKSMPAANDSCDVFIPETERLAAQALFPDRKVFASRCAEPGELFYTNVSENQRMMAVYAGSTLAEGKRVLALVRATGKFPGANLRRIRTGFNGT